MRCMSSFGILNIFLYGFLVISPVLLFDKTEVWTPDDYKYVPINKYGIAFKGTTFAFEVKACHDAHIGLLHNDADYGAMYEIVIGGWSNAKSSIRTEKQGEQRATFDSSPLSCHRFKPFWISWDNGVIWVGNGHIKDKSTVFLGWKNPIPYSISHIAITTGFGSTGTWRFQNCNDVVERPLNCVELDCKSPGFRRCIKFNCSADNRWCWPGKCSEGLASQCHCSPGFTTIKTLSTARCEPDIKPSLESCRMTLFGHRGEQVSSSNGLSECRLQSDMFGRFSVKKISFDISASFKVDTRFNITRPFFVGGEQFGITDISIEIQKITLEGNTTAVPKTFMDVQSLPADFSNDKMSLPINESLQNGEKLCVTYTVKGGGYLVSKGIYLTENTTRNVSYMQTYNTKQLCYIYDRMAPIHCSERKNCHSKPMEISERLTRSRHLTLDVEGWFDPFPEHGNQSLASGIESFEVDIYEVESIGNILKQDTKTLWHAAHNASSTRFYIHLPEKNPMLYVIFLNVKDRAENVRQARRLVLYDNSTAVLKNERKPLLVTTASNITDFKWQIHNGNLCFAWKDRFYNSGSINLLRPVKPLSPERNDSIIYDQIYGELPIRGTNNINGITAYSYVLINERTNTSMELGTVLNIQSESMCVTPNITDGDSFKFNMQAKDIMNNTLNDSVSVNIDTSVPEIVDIWLVREGHKQLYVHHSSDLSLMFINFKAFDIHSGLQVVKWTFGEYENKTVLIEKAVSVDDCIPPTSNCYSPVIGNSSKNQFTADLTKLKTENNHIGNHNRRYFFTVNVMNAAKLVALEHIDILVDESPPEVGVVSEGPIGNPDIDYTSFDEVTIKWSGFLDHESGIKIYRVSLARECLLNLNKLPVGRFNDSAVLETYHTSIKIPFPDDQGKYFASVVAFNNAMSPSKIVCSDGITFDRSTPKISNIRIKHALISESIGCINQKPYHIKEDLTTVKLEGDTCLRKCRNETDDPILNVLPGENKNKTDGSLHSFLCSNLKKYTRDTIYTPSDLFDISWDMAEDKSQIASSYIGFGRDLTAVDSPDIVTYTNVQKNSHYFQRHPGLIGEKEIYVFVKVVNRAGLEGKVWLGPILADETPPTCPSTLKSAIKDNYYIITWSSTDFLDTDQTEEIGKIIFRFGTENKLITPYMEWNIKDHGNQCGSGLRCIRFPVNRLQKYDTIHGRTFFIQLHVYNYAGHYCSVNTSSIRLPSLFPPHKGVVLDILMESKPTYNDIDVTFDLDTYCFSWNGFDHHENVRIQSGLGGSERSDDIVPFHNINANSSGHMCERLINATSGKKYYVTIKATCSGGTTYVSSDGFTILNKTDVLLSINIFHGNLCDRQSEILLLNATQSMKNHTRLYLSRQLDADSIYILSSNLKTKLSDSNTPVHIIKSDITTSGSATRFIALDSINWLIVSDMIDTKGSTNIRLFSCNSGMKAQTSTTMMPIHWTVPAAYQQFVSHYETAICGPIQKDTDCDKTIFTASGNITKYSFTGNFQYGQYKVGVKPCFGGTCLPAVWSSYVMIQQVSEQMKITKASGVTEETCLRTEITFDQLRCGTGNETFALGYRWGIFSDAQGRNMISVWRIREKIPASSVIQDAECFHLPIHLHKVTYVCVEPFCEFGTGLLSCRSIQLSSDPNTYRKDVLYDLNLNNPVAKAMEQYENSINIGQKLGKLHEIEMDFGDQNVNIGGFLLQNPVMVEWYLMKVQNVPTMQCDRDSSCMASKKTTSGFVNFGNHGLKETGVFHICARVHHILNETQNICSDGFLIDTSVPSGGKVLIESENGYIVDGSSLNLRWSGFQGNVEATFLGYPSDMSAYEYALGTHPGSTDVLMFTPCGLTRTVKINNLHLKHGQAYYATVRGYNHLNTSVDSYSQPVIYDNTPPSKGRLQLRTNYFNGFVTSRKLVVEWFDVDDYESGIQTLKVGIGSSNSSADVVPFLEYMDYAEISNQDGFQDGHQYYAILQAKNRAGLTSYTVSDPVIMDSSPPEMGHILDVLPLSNTTKEDIDYQTDTTSITVRWYGFHDSHSDISEYKVGLGSFPGNDDIMQFASVGLQTEKTWYSNLQQGVKYFSTVEACNNAGLCSRSTSNGVIIDNSAPIPGMVLVGDSEGHSRYLSDRKTLHASWIGFQDPHSDIEHFDVCITTEETKCDVMDRWNAHLSSSFTKSNLDLPIGKMMFMTVRACNNVGLCSERTSPSFIIDETAPRLIDIPRIVSPTLIDHGSYQTITDPSFFKVTWHFDDTESPIVRTSISMHSKLEAHVPINEEVLSNENEFVFQLLGNDILRLGDVYTVQVTVCNAAQLCTTNISKDILVDYTPPLLGGFMPPLRFEMVNGSILLNLSWYGFSDAETDIASYSLSVGYTYSGTELLNNMKVLPNKTLSGYEQQTDIVLASTSLKSDHLVLSLWAENFAGLRTLETKVTTEVIPTNKEKTNGDLIIQKHSCRTEFCNNDCTCAVVGNQCSNGNNMACHENTNTTNVSIDVTMIADNNITNVIGSSKCLAAVWSTKGKTEDKDILRYEYSFSIVGGEAGQGVYNLSIENPWKDNGHTTNASYCLSGGLSLRHKTKYVAYVRAWISFTEYMTFTSLPVMVDHSPPDVHKRHFVLDSDTATCNDDLDFTENLKSVYACWKNVFGDDESKIQTFIVSLGTSPSMDDIKRNLDAGLVTQIAWNDVVLEPGIKYYTTVTAVNSIGLKSELSSDGFMVDNTKPEPGIVYNTGEYRNTKVQSHLSPIKFSWHGFTDQHSFIESYQIAYVINGGSDKHLLHFKDIGLANDIIYNNIPQHGDKVVALVKARDKAGHESTVVRSPPTFIDGTPPKLFKCTAFESTFSHTENILNNKEYSFTKNLDCDLHEVIKIEVSVTKVRFGFRGNLKIGDLTLMLPFSVNSDGSVVSSFIYISQETNVKTIAIRLGDTEVNSSVNITISKCSNVTLDDDIENVMTKQLSEDSVSVCIPTIDKESGIKQISIQVGTMPSGCEIEILHPIAFHLHGIIKGNFTHGMTVYIKANVENHAGLHSVFTARPLTIDHSGPQISITNVFPNYETQQNSSKVTLEATWKAVDDESVVSFCEYCVGMLESSCGVIGWTPTLSLSSFKTKKLSLVHGSSIYGAIRCINSVELIGTAQFGPIIISYMPPITDASTVQFITESSLDADIENDLHSVTVRWNEFKDLSEIDNYFVRTSNVKTTSENWHMVGNRNYLHLSGVSGINGETFEVSVKGRNTGGVDSLILNKSILFDNKQPILTGKSIKVKHKSGDDFFATWSQVFLSFDNIREFQVSIGTSDGSTDIMMPTMTTDNGIDLNIPEDVKELYFVIQATSITAVSTVYKEKITFV